MRPALVAVGSVAALLLAIVAVVLRTAPAVALVFAALSVAAGTGALLVAVFPDESPWTRGRPGAGADSASVREWLTSGELGHEEIVRLLDRIDRMGFHPNLAVRTEPEMDAFRRMPRGRFLRFVAERMDEIEGPA